MPQLLHEGLAVRQLLYPQSNATGTVNTSSIDVTGQQRVLYLVASGVNEATATADLDVQEGGLEEIVQSLDDDRDTGVGVDDGTNVEIGFGFTTPDNGGVEVHSIEAYVKRNGTIGAGEITCTIQADNSDAPDDTDLFTPVNGSKAAAAIGTAYEVITWTLTSPLALAADTKYWLVFETGYTSNASNYCDFAVDTVASGGSSNVHASDWTTETTTQQGCFNVNGVDFVKVDDATQITTSNDTSPHLVEVPVSAGADIWQRAQVTVTNDACVFGVYAMYDDVSKPTTQTNAVPFV